MSWRDELQEASFRGVEFGVESAGGSGGRRNAVHEYPERDDPWPEDTGRGTRRPRFVGFVVGDNYKSKRDELIAALEAYGPGELVHPTRGAGLFAVERYSYSESSERGGYCKFDLEFVEYGERPWALVEVATTDVIDLTADAVTAAVSADVAERLSVAGEPSWVGARAVAKVESWIDTVNDAVVSPLVGGLSKGAEIASELSALERDAMTLLRSPLEFAASAQSIMAQVGSLSALRAIFGLVGTSASDKSTDDEQTAENNDAAIDNLFHRSAIAEAARVVADTEWDYYEQATADRDALADRIDAETEATEPDSAVYAALRDLRVAVVQDVTERAANLPRIRNHTANDETSTLVLAYRLFGDAERADEIETLNINVTNPGFVPRGEVRVPSS